MPSRAHFNCTVIFGSSHLNFLGANLAMPIRLSHFILPASVHTAQPQIVCFQQCPVRFCHNVPFRIVPSQLPELYLHKSPADQLQAANQRCPSNFHSWIFRDHQVNSQNQTGYESMYSSGILVEHHLCLIQRPNEHSNFGRSNSFCCGS